MRYPRFLPAHGTVGLVAPSLGIAGQPYTRRYDSACAIFTARGHLLKEGPCVHGFSHAQSAPAADRGAEMTAMMTAKDVDAVISVAGGEMMVEMLPYVDFARLRRAAPRWYMGFSDNTCMTFALNVLCDTASLYGSNFPSFGMRQWDRSLREAYQIMSGRRLSQTSYPRYQLIDLKGRRGHALDGYNATEKAAVKSLYTSGDLRVRGRLIGGCLDVLQLLVGTPYDKVSRFVDRYHDDGILWYLEACDLNVFSISRALWQLRQAGWLRGCSGILLGRPLHPESLMDVGLAEAYHRALDGLDVPVVYDMDFGHLPPCWTIVSGSVAQVTVQGRKAAIEYQLR